jgi:hypothetical protein
VGQSPPQHTGRNGSTISMYGRRASGRKNYATCTQSRTAGFGDLTRTVALEQSPCLPACGAGTGTSQCVGNPQAEDSNTGSVESGSGRVGGRATFRKTREVAHPRLCCAGVSGAPRAFSTDVQPTSHSREKAGKYGRSLVRFRLKMIFKHWISSVP